MSHQVGMPADEALRLLEEGNERYLSDNYSADYSSKRRLETAESGQHPYAVILTCSDSRVIPELIFSSGIGDLFVIRAAGNVVDNCTADSLIYAVEHLGCRLVVVLGHTVCGAVREALHYSGDHPLDTINLIRAAIGGETDPLQASVLNVRNSVKSINQLFDEKDVKIVGAMYDIRTGVVDFDILS